jgi:Fe-S cluster biosynthesis and repair protein YggX
MDGAYASVDNSFSTSLVRSQWNPALHIPCILGVRMPNFTDCTRYYTCDSKTGKILSYTCPQLMAFNVYKHVCETSVYSWCNKQTMIVNRLIMSQPVEETAPATTRRPSPCSTPGKIPDPNSKQHYFVCYIESDTVLSYRMACPNQLEYCASEKICKQNDCFE